VVAFSLFVILSPGIDRQTEWLASVMLLMLPLTVYQCFVTINKAVTVSGDRIQIVTALGRKLEYNATQIASLRYDPPTHQGLWRNGSITFDDGVRFVFTSVINDYDKLLMDLMAIVPADATHLGAFNEVRP
jgi:hypothetical protein